MLAVVVLRRNWGGTGAGGRGQGRWKYSLFVHSSVNLLIRRRGLAGGEKEWERGRAEFRSSWE